MDTKQLPTQERLQELFDYSVITGLLYEKTRRNGRSAAPGQPVKNSHDSKGYLRLMVDGVLYAQHRLIWKWVTGEDPPQHIDHEDQDGSNNSWHNLRLASHAQNQKNVRLSSDNTSGFKGVSYNKSKGKYEVRLQSCSKRLHLGYYDTAEQAAHAYDAVAYVLHGSFAHLNFPSNY